MNDLKHLALVAGLFSCTPALSHHSPFVKFNFQDVVTVEGVITRFDLRNPHAMLYLDVTNDGGEIENWVIEMAGLLSLTRRGWTDDTVSLGDRVTVTGNRILTGGNEMWWNSMTLDDGTVFIEPTTEDSNTIDEQRRRAAREAGQN